MSVAALDSVLTRPARLTPSAAQQLVAEGHALVDLRPEPRPSTVPGATGLEQALLGGATGVVLLCEDGDASAFAALSLSRLGVRDVASVAGGVAAWARAGLPVLTAVPLEVDVDRWEVRVHGEPVALTRQEFKLLQALDAARGRVLTRQVLADLLDCYPATTRALDVHVCRLRRKLGDEGRRVLTVRGVGWRLLLD